MDNNSYNWPSAVPNLKSEPNFPPFESYRSEFNTDSHIDTEKTL